MADVVTDSRPEAMTAALALVPGLVALAAGLLRLGFISNFVSEPVLKGFIVGMALTIIIGQVPKLFGLEGGEGNFFEKSWDVITDLGDTSLVTLGVGVASLALVLALRRYLPGVPGSLVAVILGVVVVRPETGLFFANAEAVRTRVRAEVAAARPHGVVLDAETVPSIDLTAVGVLEQLADDLERDGVELVIARDVGQVRDVIERGAGRPAFGARTFRSVREAVEAVRCPDTPTEGD